MGYYVDLTDAWAILPASNYDEAYKRLCELNKRDDLKSGGSWSGGKQTSVWFSWMSADYPDHHKDARSILEAVGYETADRPDGFALTHYNDKTGCEDVFVWAIADLFEENNYMVWRGEENEQYRWEFGGGMPMLIQNAIIEWTDGDVYIPNDYSKLNAISMKLRAEIAGQNESN